LNKHSKTVRILGIDPGSLVTGFGIIDSNGNENHHVASGAIKTRGDELPDRLKTIFEGISDVIRTHAPEIVAVEKVFMNRNADSALKLGQARGAAITAAVMQDIPVAEYTPRHIKQAVVGKGAADKSQVQHMVKVLVNFQGDLQPDQADALAVALCHGHIQATMQRLPQAHRPSPYRRKIT
jgi:crossover junction endodeoxyribonuclease RuvC